MNAMGPRCGAVIRVKNPIKTRKYIFDLNAVIDVTIHPGAIGYFWDLHLDCGCWNVSFFKHPEIEGEGYGILDPGLDDIEFVPKDQYLSEWGPPPDALDPEVTRA